ncbi:MAG: RNA polymerase sigma factor, partial [Eubacteriales bacterium]
KALACLHELEEPYKEVFMLSVFGDISMKDISKLFGKSESWARVTFYRAKQKILERMR